MSKTFAQTTGQPGETYYSKDMRGRGKKKTELSGIAAEAAWRLPIKDTKKNLPGRAIYVPGMPVFCTENIATELGISKGGRGTLVSVKYTEKEGRRYAVSAEADFPGYKGDNPDHPHRLLL
ncbi:hypothetical protein FB45DRAFT_708136, partial [Roridomyces roridus]